VGEIIWVSEAKGGSKRPKKKKKSLGTQIIGKFKDVTSADDRLYCLVVRVPGYTTEMYCASCEVRTEFIYVM
jgi:hypothetical protein